ncbi:MAG: Fic family protein [Gemmatimonadetes bacterium]|nr:Fic family protein [Gemmatimonadota bacterium]
MKVPTTPPNDHEVMRDLLESADRREQLLRVFQYSARAGAAEAGRYRHWHTFRQIELPEGIPHEQAWAAIKMARRSLYEPLPFRDSRGRQFVIATPAPALAMLHRCDLQAGGTLLSDASELSPGQAERFLVSGLMEEAVTSSQLEGASTTRRVGKDLLREGRAPRDRSERMIANNYAAIRHVRAAGAAPLTPAFIEELQSILTEGTLEITDGGGRYRRDDEEIGVTDLLTGAPLHTPPPARELPGRVELLCAFANEAPTEATGAFLHPVARAIILHFMIGYDHPFVDGNGRTARAVFYWAMKRAGYWLAEYASISRILREARGKYGRAFLYSETDEGDLTYFLLHQLRVFGLAVEQLREYVRQKLGIEQAIERQLAEQVARRLLLNDRQVALVAHAMRHPDARYSIESHSRSHHVSGEAARQDLNALVAAGLLERRRAGRFLAFWPKSKLRELLDDKATTKSLRTGG